MRALVLFPLLALGACAQLPSYGAVAIEHRRVMNDMQARAALAATCDMALGAYFRELSPIERRYAGLVCRGMLRGIAITPMTEPQAPRPARS
jgi:hypothetical protein